MRRARARVRARKADALEHNTYARIRIYYNASALWRRRRCLWLGTEIAYVVCIVVEFSAMRTVRKNDSHISVTFRIWKAMQIKP